METIGSKRSYALIWCTPNNDDDDAMLSPCKYIVIGNNNGSSNSSIFSRHFLC